MDAFLYEHSRGAVVALRELFTHTLPGPAPHLIEQVREHCITLHGIDDAYIGEKTGLLEKLSGDYFSAKKHQNYSHGANQIRAEIFNLLSRIERIIESNKP